MTESWPDIIVDDNGVHHPVSIEHSASSLELYLGCARRWVFERIHGFRQEDTEQKGFGKDRHAELQAWIDSGKLPEHILSKYLLALYAKHPFPPGRLTDKAEEHFRMEILGVKWHGYTDRRRQGRHPGHRIVGDWKTTKDLKYALVADKAKGLLVDRETGVVKAQPVIYATREYVQGADEVTLSWAYGQSKDPWATRLVEVDVNRDACEDAYGEFHASALEMNTLYQIRPKANDVPYDKGYCNAFNKPCEQSGRCNRARGMFTSDTLGEMKMQDFLKSMKGSFPGGAQTIEEEDAPPPPPDEDDAPPPPDEDDDAPPPPPDEEEIEAERLAQEYMASKRQPKAAPTEVEAGFVNAPEAAGKKPYATPEEAAVGEGVATIGGVPVTEENVTKWAAEEMAAIEGEVDAAVASGVMTPAEGKKKRGRPKKVVVNENPTFVSPEKSIIETTAEPVKEVVLGEHGLCIGHPDAEPVLTKEETAAVSEEVKRLVETDDGTAPEFSPMAEEIRKVVRRELKNMLATLGTKLVDIASIPDDNA